jgi:hypothetical protein
MGKAKDAVVHFFRVKVKGQVTRCRDALSIRCKPTIFTNCYRNQSCDVLKLFVLLLLTYSEE